MYKHELIAAPKVDRFLKELNDEGHTLVCVTSHYVPETNVLNYSIFYKIKSK